jgi:hypothetical protein
MVHQWGEMNHNPKSPLNKNPTKPIVLDLQKSYIDAKSFVKFALGDTSTYIGTMVKIPKILRHF